MKPETSFVRTVQTAKLHCLDAIEVKIQHGIICQVFISACPAVLFKVSHNATNLSHLFIQKKATWAMRFQCWLIALTVWRNGAKRRLVIESQIANWIFGQMCGELLAASNNAAEQNTTEVAVVTRKGGSL